KSLTRSINLPIGPDLFVAVVRRPFGHVRVKTFAILNNRSEQPQLATVTQLSLQSASKLVSGLSFDGYLTVGTKLSSQSREQQPYEMVNLSYRGNGALASAAAGALFNADRRGDARDEVDFRPRQLFHELAGVNVHGIQETPLAFGKEQIECKSA